MKEYNRELAIFGNFSHITIEDIREKLVDLKEKNSFQYGTVQDSSAIILPMGSAPMRPALSSEDGQTSVVFGISRIYFQENSGNIDSYNDFMTKGIDIFTQIIDSMEVPVSRLAANGSFIEIDDSTINKIYASTFNKDSVFYNDNSEEWDFSMNILDDPTGLPTRVNQIIKVIRGLNITGRDGAMAGPMAIVYDYNTQPAPNSTFSSKDLAAFAQLASDFREKVKAYGR